MDYFSGWCKNKRRLDGYTVIITGSNTGIGKEVAFDLYGRGARVIMACRDITKAEAAKKEIEEEAEAVEEKGTLIIEKLDLSSLKSVREFAFRVLAHEKEIHILVNNAGVMMCPASETEDGLETQIGTNHFGHALLTLLLLPRLIKSTPSRILFVSSYLHARFSIDVANLDKSISDPFEAYCRSKAANVLFAKALALKLQEHNINYVTTYSLHPGVINTEIGRHFDKTVGYGASWLFKNIVSWFIKSPRCGAQTTVYCIVDEKCANESGLYYSDCMVKFPSEDCQDNSKAINLWNTTLDLLNINPEKYDPFADQDPREDMFD